MTSFIIRANCVQLTQDTHQMVKIHLSVNVGRQMLVIDGLVRGWVASFLLSVT